MTHTCVVGAETGLASSAGSLAIGDLAGAAEGYHEQVMLATGGADVVRVVWQLSSSAGTACPEVMGIRVCVKHTAKIRRLRREHRLVD